MCMYRSQGFALKGYVVSGCVEDGAWMLLESSSVAVVVVAVAVVVVAHPGLGRSRLSVLLRLRRFQDARIDPSRLPSTAGTSFEKSCRRTKQIIKNVENIKSDQNGHSIKIPYKNAL